MEKNEHRNAPMMMMILTIRAERYFSRKLLLVKNVPARMAKK